MTLKDAYEIAKKKKGNITDYSEFEDYFIFYSKQDEGSDGGDGPCVILKDTGEALNFLAIIGKPSTLIREGVLSNIKE